MMIDLIFANSLRHILRQDCDVIRIGEIRDRETVEIAIQASLTGHLVHSALHTDDAPSALNRHQTCAWDQNPGSDRANTASPIPTPTSPSRPPARLPFVRGSSGMTGHGPDHHP
jgi:hypothetical protein